MTHLTRASLAVAFAAILPLSSLSSQSLAPDAGSSATATAPDPANIGELWASAESLRADGQLREARQRFAEIADLQTSNFENAARTYWVIAEVHNALGEPLQTAQALDRAADQAARYGDHELQARSLFEAAVAYSKANVHDSANDRMRSLDSLLASAEVSEEVRTNIESRSRRLRL
jgi:tetratricopeptide (TPR) repeat protein